MIIGFVIVVCVFLAFVFSGAESALLTISRVRTRHAVEEGDKAAARLLKLLEHRVDLLHSVTAANHCFALLGFVLTVAQLVRWLGPWGWAVTLVVAIPAFLLVLEMLPKQLFHRHPLGLLTLMARPLQLLLKIARPWLWCASQFQSRVLHDVPAESDQPSMAALAKSIDSLAVLHPVVGKLLSQAGRLQEMAARDCMMPFKQVSALPPDMPMSAALALCREQNLAWSPVMAADGSMQGWLDTAALPSRIAQDKLVRQYIRPLSQMRATESALRCLQALRRRGEPLGLVIDDKGESVGIITQRSIIGVVLKLNGAHGVAGNGYGTGTGIGTANGNGNGKS